jgi:hypothetical protein
VLTYDGITGGVPDWVDHAPGGTDPADSARGADYVVGACGGAGGPGGPGAGPGRTVAVSLSAPSRLRGGGRAMITGSVTPARAGVLVSIKRTAHRATTTRVRTEADGSFALIRSVKERTRVQALAEGIHSDTLTIEMRSRTRLRVRHSRSGAAYLGGRVRPALPGRVLLLRPGSPGVVARRSVSHGAFRFRPKPHRRLRGAYQVVYVPSHGRADRSTSNTVRVP